MRLASNLKELLHQDLFFTVSNSVKDVFKKTSGDNAEVTHRGLQIF